TACSHCLPPNLLAGPEALLHSRRPVGATSRFVSLNPRRGDRSKFPLLLRQACRDAVRAIEAHFQTQPAETAWSARRTRRQRMLAHFFACLRDERLTRREVWCASGSHRLFYVRGPPCNISRVALRKGSA